MLRRWAHNSTCTDAAPRNRADIDALVVGSPSYWRHVALTWYLTESVKNFNRIWCQVSICNYCIPQGPPMHFLNHREWKIIMAYHMDQRCNYPLYLKIFLLRLALEEQELCGRKMNERRIYLFNFFPLCNGVVDFWRLGFLTKVTLLADVRLIDGLWCVCDCDFIGKKCDFKPNSRKWIV
jgi:hypothetical protein